MHAHWFPWSCIGSFVPVVHIGSFGELPSNMAAVAMVYIHAAELAKPL